jgi:hypothetical protein
VIWCRRARPLDFAGFREYYKFLRWRIPDENARTGLYFISDAYRFGDACSRELFIPGLFMREWKLSVIR